MPTEKKGFEKYDSTKLDWCNYPFEDNALGYCWGYAHFIDGSLQVLHKPIKTMEDLKKYCETCDLNKNYKAEETK